MTKRTVIFDTETYRDYFLASFLDIESHHVIEIEAHPDQALDVDALKANLRGCTLVGFNSANFDLPVIAVASLPRAVVLAAFDARLARNAVLFGLGAALVCLLSWAVAAALARGAKDRAAVDAARREMQVVQDATAEGVFAVDPDWRITFANRQAVALVGRGVELSGAPLWQSFPSPLPETFETAYREAMATRAPHSAEGGCPMTGRRLRIDIQPRGASGGGRNVCSPATCMGVWRVSMSTKLRSSRLSGLLYGMSDPLFDATIGEAATRHHGATRPAGRLAPQGAPSVSASITWRKKASIAAGSVRPAAPPP
jgi:PAS domain-containing protein